MIRSKQRAPRVQIQKEAMIVANRLIKCAKWQKKKKKGGPAERVGAQLVGRSNSVNPGGFLSSFLNRVTVLYREEKEREKREGIGEKRLFRRRIDNKWRSLSCTRRGREDATVPAFFFLFNALFVYVLDTIPSPPISIPQFALHI
jgi:hypothetical protein